MDAVSYPDNLVVGFMSRNLIPLRLKSDAEPYVTSFRLRWTPTLITLDPDGLERQRTVGFLQPVELIASLLLGLAKVDLDMGCYVEALERLNRITTEYATCGVAPEAAYLYGVTSYKKEGDPRALKDAYETLNKDYPGDLWTRRAAPYRLL